MNRIVALVLVFVGLGLVGCEGSDPAFDLALESQGQWALTPEAEAEVASFYRSEEYNRRRLVSRDAVVGVLPPNISSYQSLRLSLDGESVVLELTGENEQSPLRIELNVTEGTEALLVAKSCLSVAGLPNSQAGADIPGCLLKRSRRLELTLTRDEQMALVERISVQYQNVEDQVTSCQSVLNRFERTGTDSYLGLARDLGLLQRPQVGFDHGELVHPDVLERLDFENARYRGARQ